MTGADAVWVRARRVSRAGVGLAQTAGEAFLRSGEVYSIHLRVVRDGKKSLIREYYYICQNSTTRQCID